jgi:Mg/Co/Ni transporter MgtE
MARLNLNKRQKNKDFASYMQKNKSDSAIRTRLKKTHPYDIGEALITLEAELKKRVFSLITAEKLSLVFEHMEK